METDKSGKLPNFHDEMHSFFLNEGSVIHSKKEKSKRPYTREDHSLSQAKTAKKIIRHPKEA